MTRRPAQDVPAPARAPQARYLELVRLDDLERAPRNPKAHADDVIAGSVDHFGLVELITLDERTGRIVAGHGRLDSLLARRDAGATPPDGIELDTDGGWLVPVVRGWRSRSDADAESYLVTSNESTILGGWHRQELTELLAELEATSPQLLAVTGFTAADLDQMRADAAHATARAQSKTDPDDIPDPPPPVTQPGDLWLMGPHRLACGDSSDPAVLERLLDGDRARCLFTSPPYNIGAGYDSHDDKPTTWADYRAFLSAVLAATIAHVSDGGAVCWNIGTNPKTFHARQHLLLEEHGLTYLRTLVWQKVGVPLPLWHNTEADPRSGQFTPNYTHELVLVFARGDHDPAAEPDQSRALAAWPTRRPLTPAERAELVVIFAKGPKLKKGKPVSVADILANDVFTMAQPAATRDLPDGNATGRRTGGESNLDRRSVKAHPAPFPVALPEAFITHLADVGDIVLDPFAGVASTLLAAFRTGRRGYGVELDPGYVDVAVRRFEAHTGLTPVNAATGRPHTFLDN